MFNDSFIAGINTPKGIAAYHIKLKYWQMFYEESQVLINNIIKK